MKILQTVLVFSAIWVATSGLLVAEALAGIVSLTEGQVNNVCGKDLQTADGHSGCTKKCANGVSTCIYDCSKKTGECNGVAIGIVVGGPKRLGPKGDILPLASTPPASP